MDSVNISKLDLNLLRTFVVLMEERNVSRASERLNISQSAASNALERIRESFQDRILERKGRVMQPTRAAEYLLPKISAALMDIEHALGSYSTFKPEGLKETFTIGIDEYSMALMGKTLMDSIFNSAPNVDLVFMFADPSRYSDQLARNEVDVLVAPVWQSWPGVLQTTLYTEDFIGLMSDTHPLVGQKVTLKKYVSYPHLLVSSRGIVQGNVDVGLRSKNVERRVLMSTPWFESAPAYLANTQMLLNMGRKLGEKMSALYPVEDFELPVAVPGFDVCMLWHPRNSTDSHQVWLRDRIVEVFQA